MAQARKSKELDHYLKSFINSVPKKLDSFINSNDKKMTYYTGNWATDVSNNFTEKQSEKIFKTMSKYMNNNDLQFFQKKNKNIEIGTWSEYGENEPESISSYDYIVIRRGLNDTKNKNCICNIDGSFHCCIFLWYMVHI